MIKLNRIKETCLFYRFMFCACLCKALNLILRGFRKTVETMCRNYIRDHTRVRVDYKTFCTDEGVVTGSGRIPTPSGVYTESEITLDRPLVLENFCNGYVKKRGWKVISIAIEGNSCTVLCKKRSFLDKLFNIY